MRRSALLAEVVWILLGAATLVAGLAVFGWL
jgi:hypothetical protein